MTIKDITDSCRVSSDRHRVFLVNSRTHYTVGSRLIKEGLGKYSRKKIKAWIVSIMTSKTFVEGGFEALSDTTRELLEDRCALLRHIEHQA